MRFLSRMRFLGRWIRRLRDLFRRRDRWEELDREMRFHLEMETRQLMEDEGLGPEEARRRARVAFGGVDRFKEEVRTAMGTEWLETLAQDLRYGVRSLAKSPGFTVSALVVLALGIGANTAIFQVVNGVVLKPLPYPDSERLVRVYQASPTRGQLRGTLSLPNFRDWRERTGTLAEMGLYSTLPSDVVLTGRGEAEELETAYVAGGFFATLGVQAAAGRTFGPEADREGSRVVVLSHDYWQRRFGGEGGLVGTTLTLDQEPYEVVGIMPPGFAFPSPDIEAWVPLTVIPASSIPLELRFVRFLHGIGRLEAGVSREAAQDELSGVAAGLEREYPDANAGLGAATLVPLRDVVVGQDVERALLVVMGAVGFILLLACTNVANLLLARGSRRRRELAVRMSLGASSGRLVRQLLTESTVLAVAGGALGVALSWWGGGFLLARSAEVLPRVGEVGMDGAVVGFAFVATLATVALFGVLPAFRSTDLELSRELKEGTRGSGEGRRGVSLRRGLVAAQVAVAVVLLVGAGLLVRSLGELGRVDPGFETEGLVALNLTISDQKYPERADYMGVYHRLMDEAARIPGVEEVASIRQTPLRGGVEQIPFFVPGVFDPAPNERPMLDAVHVSADLFRTMGIRLVAGRGFDPGSGPEDPLVVVVNQALVEAYFENADPVGRTVVLAGEYEAEVIGVVEDVRHHEISEPASPTIYVHQEQNSRRGMTVVARVDGEVGPVMAELRRVVTELDRDQAVSELTVLSEVVSDSLVRPRFFTLLLGSFAALAAVLAALGIYGVIAYVVRQRVREMGLRIALGARGRDVVGLVVGQGMVPVGAGLALGLGAAVVLSRLMEGLLYGVSGADPVTYAAVGLGLAAVAGLACFVPARRAAAVDPVRALTSE